MNSTPHRNRRSFEASRVYGRAGLALIEVVVAAVLVLTVLGVTMGTVATATSTVNASHVAAKAASLLNRKMVEVRASDFAELTVAGSQEGTELVEARLSHRIPLNWKRSVESSSTRGDTLIVTCTVQWTTRGETKAIQATQEVTRSLVGTTVAQSAP